MLKPVSLILKLCHCLVAPQRRKVNLSYAGLKSTLIKILSQKMMFSLYWPVSEVLFLMQCLLSNDNISEGYVKSTGCNLGSLYLWWAVFIIIVIFRIMFLPENKILLLSVTVFIFVSNVPLFWIQSVMLNRLKCVQKQVCSAQTVLCNSNEANGWNTKL